jgi:hypothetical protein
MNINASVQILIIKADIHFKWDLINQTGDAFLSIGTDKKSQKLRLP